MVHLQRCDLKTLDLFFFLDRQVTRSFLIYFAEYNYVGISCNKTIYTPNTKTFSYKPIFLHFLLAWSDRQVTRAYNTRLLIYFLSFLFHVIPIQYKGLENKLVSTVLVFIPLMFYTKIKRTIIHLVYPRTVVYSWYYKITR